MPRQRQVLRPCRSAPGCNDFEMKGRSCWITVNNLSVWLRRSDGAQGIVVEVYPKGHEAEATPLAGISALFSDAKAS